MWWVDPGWMPGALCHSPPQLDRGEKI